MSASPRSVLVTGFGAFGGHDRNPSAEAVRELARGWQPPAGAVLVTEILPVSFERARRRLGELIEDHRPALVLSVGLAAGRERLGVERVAINLADAPIPDVDGSQPADAPLESEGPPARFSTLPVKRIVAALRGADLPAEVSLTAGGYVCNAVMYTALGAAPAGAPAGFLHVPAEDRLAVPDAVRAVRIAIETTLAAGDDPAADDPPGDAAGEGGRLPGGAIH